MMSILDGESLALYVNRNSARFEAGVLRISAGCWVLLRDKERSGRRGQPMDLAPIVDFEPYLLHVSRDSDSSYAGLGKLLRDWQAKRHAV